MLSTIIIFYPKFALGCALLGLFGVSLIAFSPRRRAVVLALLILAPVAPLLLVRFVLVTLIDLIDDLCHAGPWIKPIRWAGETLSGKDDHD